jgi:hypothetical protein
MRDERAVWNAYPMPADLRIAPMWRRVLAVPLNVVGGLTVGGSAIAAGFGAAAAYERLRGKPESPETENNEKARRFDLSARQQRLLWVASAGVSVWTRNWRSPAFRCLGLRRVDLDTGGAVSVRSAIVGVLYDRALEEITNPALRSRTDGTQGRLDALKPQIDEISREYADDPAARQRALADFYKTHELNPFGSCVRPIMPIILARLLADLVPLRGQNLRDLVTGTVVVIDP